MRQVMPLRRANAIPRNGRSSALEILRLYQVKLTPANIPDVVVSVVAECAGMDFAVELGRETHPRLLRLHLVKSERLIRKRSERVGNFSGRVTENLLARLIRILRIHHVELVNSIEV